MSVALKRTFDETLDRIQVYLDGYMEFYNREISHQAYRTIGRTLYRTFLEGMEQDSRASGA